MALVSIDGISGLRYTLPLTAPVYWTCVTGPIRAIIAGRCIGQLGGLAEQRLPVGHVEQVRPEPVDLVEKARPARRTERPSTATIAATPIAIPSADSAARTLRVRRPTAREPREVSGAQLVHRQGGRGHGRPHAVLTNGVWVGTAGGARLSGCRRYASVARVLSATMRPSSISICRGTCARRSSRSWVITMIVAPSSLQLLRAGRARLAGGTVEVAGRLVGEHDRRLADQRAGDRDALALDRLRAASGGRAARSARPTRVERAARLLAALIERSRRRRAARRRRYRATLSCSARKNCWKTNPIRVARRAASSRSESRRNIEPGDPYAAAARPVKRAHQVQQRRSCPDPDGPTTASSSPAVTREAHVP